MSITNIFKKGVRSIPGNYRSIRVLNSRYKIYSRILDNRPRSISDSEIGDDHNDFEKGGSYIDNNFTVQPVIKKERV